MFAPTKKDAIEIGWKLSQDSLISTQKIVYRKYEKLITYEIGINGLPFTEEYRCFCFKGEILTYGYYWTIADKPRNKSDLSKNGYDFACIVAKEASKFANFYVIDIAQKEDGSWILVEINSGCMSGLSDVDPEELYSNLALCQYI